jgi:hypothetical protein
MATATGTYATAALVKARLFAAGVTDTADDTLIGTICDQVNQFIESPQGCGRVLAPVTTATYLVDGNGLRRLFFPRGLRAVTALAIGDYTGDTRDTLAVTDYWLRPSATDRKPGWPAEWIEISDRPAGTHSVFHVGYETVSITGTIGWNAIPDDIIDVALTTAVRAWHARQSGQADVIGNDETGAPLVSRYVSGYHWSTIRAYRVRRQLVHGG